MEKKKRKILFRTLILSAATVLSGYATSFSRNIILKEEIDLNRINNLHLYVRNEPYDMEVFYSFKYDDIFRYEDEYYKNDPDLKFKNEDVYEMKQWLININNSLGILKDDEKKH